MAHVGGLASRFEGADEADVACHLGLTHVDIDLGAVHEQLGLIAGMPPASPHISPFLDSQHHKGNPFAPPYQQVAKKSVPTDWQGHIFQYRYKPLQIGLNDAVLDTDECGMILV